MTGTASILRADARHLPLADDTVDLVVTSPPYFALRSYQDGGQHYDGQIGDEPTPAEFVDALLEVTRECVRVLKPSGSLWVNLGDKYAGSPRNMPTHNGTDPRMSTSKFSRETLSTGDEYETTVRPKSLIGIPWRYAIRCIDELGLILRAEVVWSKPNGLPESVTDRVRRSHEQWFHFTLAPRYYSAVDEIREPQESLGKGRPWSTDVVGSLSGSMSRWGEETGSQGLKGNRTTDQMNALNPLGKLPGSVWTIPTEPLVVPPELGIDHFAAFPTEFPRRIIQGWSPAGVCVECGEGRRPVVTRHHERPAGDWNPDRNVENRPVSLARPSSEVTVDGYACACPEPTAPTTPGIVLDPFGGTGTTALVAKALGRHGISVDMSADYCRLAEWRTNDPAQLAKAARKPYTPSQKPLDGQGDLLDLIGEESA